MKCGAKINDAYGNKYSCLEDAEKKITIKTFAPHLNKEVQKTRHLCNHHAGRLLNRHRYKIKHLGKKTELIVEEFKTETNEL